MSQDSENPRVFTLTINLGNDCMQMPEDVALQLERTSKYMRKHGSWPPETLYDLDGNAVGLISVI